MRKVLKVWLPEELARELDELAKSTGRSKSDIVRDSLSLYLWESRFRVIRCKFTGRAKKRGINTEEDALNLAS